MSRSIFAIVTIGLALAAVGRPAGAADLPPYGAAHMERGPAGGFALPFPRGERAQSVWASGLCWSQCGAVTTWDLNACLAADAQGRCLKRADAGDRSCQRQCRTSGGPLLPLDF